MKSVETLRMRAVTLNRGTRCIEDTARTIKGIFDSAPAGERQDVQDYYRDIETKMEEVRACYVAMSSILLSHAAKAVIDGTEEEEARS